MDQLLFIAKLHRVTATYPGEVELRVVDGGILELWAGGLVSKLGESGDRLRIQRTDNAGIGGQSVGDAVLGEERWLTLRIRRLGADVACPGETNVQKFVLADDPGGATSDLTILNVDVRVGVATSRTADSRRIEDLCLMLTVAAEEFPFREALVDSGITLVVIDCPARCVAVIVRDVVVCRGRAAVCASDIVGRKCCKDGECERRRCGRNIAGGVGGPRQRVIERD